MQVWKSTGTVMLVEALLWRDAQHTRNWGCSVLLSALFPFPSLSEGMPTITTIHWPLWRRLQMPRMTHKILCCQRSFMWCQWIFLISENRNVAYGELNPRMHPDTAQSLLISHGTGKWIFHMSAHTQKQLKFHFTVKCHTQQSQTHPPPPGWLILIFQSWRLPLPRPSPLGWRFGHQARFSSEVAAEMQKAEAAFHCYLQVTLPTTQP